MSKKNRKIKKGYCFTVTKTTVERVRKMGKDLKRTLSMQMETIMEDAVNEHEANKNK